MAKRLRALTILTFCIAVVVSILGVVISFSGSQASFVLDTQVPLINYSLSKFNDSTATKEFDFANSTDNHTFYISLPKKSQVTNLSMNMTGKITTIYKKDILATEFLKGFSSGDVNNDSYNEIVTGRSASASAVPNLMVLNGSDGVTIWSYSLSNPSHEVFSTAVGNVATNPGSEVAFGAEDNYVYLLDSSGGQLWNYSTGSDVRAVAIANLTGSGNVVIAGSMDKNVYVLNSSGGLLWSYTTDDAIYDLATGDLTGSPGLEIAAASGSKIYILNSTGGKVLEYALGNAILSIDAGNVTADAGDEIVTGDQLKMLFLFNANDTNLTQVWNFTAGDQINSVAIGNAINDLDYPGNEVVAGSDDKRVYTFAGNGTLIWDFTASGYVRTVTIGEFRSTDAGLEVAAGDSSVYMFNFDYFPTNLTVSIDGYYNSWTYQNFSGKTKLRTPVTATGQNLTSNINSYLSGCTADARGNCNVPLVFHSDWKGKLNISSILAEYRYNFSDIMSTSRVGLWSRISEIVSNESVGSSVYNLTFSGTPAENATISYIAINDSATMCDFNLSSYNVTTSEGKKVCNISSKPINLVGGTPVSFSVLLWDDTMGSANPISVNTTAPYYTNAIDNYTWRYNLTLNSANGTFYNVTTSASLNDSIVRNSEFLTVYLNGLPYDITPDSPSNDCNTSSPTYQAFSILSSTFYSCYKDTGADGTLEYFKWKQPVLYQANSTTYILGGDYNIHANLSSFNISPASAIWGQNYSFYTNVGERDGDMVNVSLWVYEGKTGSWSRRQSLNASVNMTLIFNITSDINWSGQSRYLFEYFDLNASNPSQIFHTSRNTTPQNFTVGKHNVQMIYDSNCSGNGSSVFRGNSILLSAFANDTNSTNAVSGANCSLWVNGTYLSANLTNSSGYCKIYFTPNQSFTPSDQNWTIGIYNDISYNNSNSTGLDVKIRGWLSPAIFNALNSSFYRGVSSEFKAGLFDEYSQAPGMSNYNCSFSLNSTGLGTNATSAGNCSLYYAANCAGPGSSVGPKNLSVSISRIGGDDYYNISSSSSETQALLKDLLGVSISLPQDQNYYVLQNISLNASVNDSCTSLPLITVNWSLVRKSAFNLTITDQSGSARQNYPVVLSGSNFSAFDFNLTDWKINRTKVLFGGSEVSFSIFAWTDAGKNSRSSSPDTMNDYSELVFLVNLSAGQAKTYLINLSTLNAAQYPDLNYSILNSGFDTGDFSYWNRTTCGNSGCASGISSDGSSVFANISADDAKTILFQALPNLTFPQTVYIKYKAWGEFNSTLYPGYFYMTVGNYTCNFTSEVLSKANGSIYVPQPVNWTISNCTNVSFASARNISITIEDKGNGGGEPSNTIALIDYVCFGDSLGNCTYFHSGKNLSAVPDTKKNLGVLSNYTLSGWEEVGRRKIVAEAQAQYYDSGKATRLLNITGFAKLSEFTVNSSSCVVDLYNTSLCSCMLNSTPDIVAKLVNNFTLEPVYNFTVAFYNNTTAIGQNQTSFSGFSIFKIQVGPSENYTYYANISSRSEVFHNSSEPSVMGLFINVDSNSTKGNLTLNATNVTATNVSLDRNFSFSLLWLLENTGEYGMYSVNTSHTEVAGIDIPDISCSSLANGSNCTRTLTINVTNDASEGDHLVIFNVTWRNGDGTYSNISANLSVYVSPTRRARFQQQNISMEIPVTTNSSAVATLLNYGNVNLSNVNISIGGTHAAIVANWTTISPNVTSILKGGYSNITLSLDIPENTTLGAYYFNMTAVVSNCTENCSSTVTVILNVTPIDWKVEPGNNLSKVVGLKEEVNKFGEILVTNNLQTGLQFNISISPKAGTALEFLTINQTMNQTSMLVNVSADSSQIIEVFYNTSVSPNTTGTYNYTLLIDSLDQNITPDNKTMSLYFEVINFTLDIFSPTKASPFGNTTPVSINDTLYIEAEAKTGTTPVQSNITWNVTVGGENCIMTQDPAYNATSQRWMLRCSAPHIPLNPIYNDLEVIVNYTTRNVELSDIEENAVIYNDTTAPWFSDVSASYINRLDNKASVYFDVNVTDNKNLSTIWAIVTRPDGQNITLNSLNYTATKRYYASFDSYRYNFTFSNPNIEGDYDIIVYATDIDSHQNTTAGWFDVYLPINVSGNLTNAKGTSIDANITFYRGGHNQSRIYRMDNDSLIGDAYNWTLHKRKYDVKIEAFGHEIVLNEVDFNMTANQSTNPFRIDYFRNKSSQDVTNILLPDTANRQNILLAIVVESTPNLTGANFTMNYTEALGAGSFTESLLEAFVCSNWSYASRICNGGEFSYLADISNLSSSNPDTSANTFSFYSSHLSAYALAESSYPYKWGISPENPDDENRGPSGGGSGGNRAEAVKIVCGNDICEVGENADNCPEDCLREFPLRVDTNLYDARLFPGESKSYWMSLENRFAKNISVYLEFSESVRELLSLDQQSIIVPANGSAMVNMSITIPKNMTFGTYGGYIVATAGGDKKIVPFTITILESAASIFSIEVGLMADQIAPNGKIDFVVNLVNLGDKGIYPITLTYIIRNPKNKDILKEYRSNVSLETTIALSESMDISVNETGFYTLEVQANYKGKVIMDVATFQVVKPIFESPLTLALLVLALFTIVAVGNTYIWRYYNAWKKEREKQQRYFYALDYGAVPKDGFRMGKFAQKDNWFFYDPRDLSTHVIIAGATGSGKSVSASIFAEEALEKKIPVIVFDPTAQWTGFVKPCKDKNLLNRYSYFKMDDFDIKSYPGLIYDVETPDFKLDIKKFINPGEITVFCLNRLKPGEYDIAVNNIISSIFGQTWEESTELKVLVVFDEVHRLLEKYGGSGGYVSLEKAAREFRKWGIGVVMCSQVLADFKEAIAGNVLTEVQLNTKSLSDIDKVKTKYGDKYAERIARMAVGVGLVQHPKYNSGKPFFVEFRPTKHNPHKITDEELAIYKNYTERLDSIGAKLELMKKKGIYTENYEIDYKLALDKLKKGNFRMAEVYISSLEGSLERIRV